ncbi:hypothetical protein K505DRAFT_157759 [Melanomma pulvis-pyrius CBS 109.77]|uniref:Uncharacterized protein n=1 Tax=Melanomma pulvis-pyrius CBS 109.77 TaxID=1314802 RepID=A0A6A6WPP2_9PLEO|nr:hypothetical protein K505DRAFT_157759 [Melanomma pulvis-pyrius CBS 109.77]
MHKMATQAIPTNGQKDPRGQLYHVPVVSASKTSTLKNPATPSPLSPLHGTVESGGAMPPSQPDPGTPLLPLSESRSIEQMSV